MFPARGSKTATEAAGAGCGSAGRKPGARRFPAPRLLFAAMLAALLVIWVATSVPGFASQPMFGATHGPADVRALTPGHGTASGPVALVKRRKPRRNSGKAVIGLFKATPSTVAPSGGMIHLDALVQGASSCRFSSSKTLAQLPATKACESGSVSVDLKLPKNTSSSSRTFQFELVAKGAGGAARAVPIAVVERGSKAASAPRIAVQPASATAAAGSTATFDAAAAGPASVQWQISTDGGRDWALIAGANETSYSFAASEGENGFEFRAVFSRHQRTTATNAATLTVTQATAAGSNHPPSSPGGGGQSDAAPAITLQPTPDGVVASAAATFTAQASGSPVPTVQWQVSADGGASWTDVADPTATSATLSFAAAAVESPPYEYHATFTNRAGTATSDPATLYVVTGSLAPAAIISPPSNESAVAGAQATFTAAPSGNPFPSVQWEVSNDGGATFTAIPGANATTYSFTAKLDDSGEWFKAVFTNVTGQVTNQVFSQPVTLTVTVPPMSPSVTGQPANQAVIAGRSATFTAAASGNPTPTVQWQVSTDHGSSWNKAAGAGATSSVYSFQALAGDNGSEYRAEFTNGIGPSVDSNPATLVVGADTPTSNWSGYVATGTTFSSVSGNWTVPVATCPSQSPLYASEWVGIDGYTSLTVEQDGTDSDCNGTTPAYYAWYEMYPAGSFQLPYTVAAGDPMSASVSVSGSVWTLSLTDHAAGTRYWTWSISPAPVSGLAQSSAEWIVERPQLCSGSCQYTSLADFGTVGFTNGTANGSPISSFTYTPLEMGDTVPSPTTLLALPSPLNGSGNAFSDTWYASN